MKRKIKMVLLAMTLCLVIGLQSMETAQAAVNYEACPFCGTMVTRGERTKVDSMIRLGRCKVHEKCDIYYVQYSKIETVTCQTSGCPNYNRDTDKVLSTWSTDEAHVTQ